MRKLAIIALMIPFSAQAQMPPQPYQLFKLHDAINQACGCQILRLDTHNDPWPRLDDYTIDFPDGTTTVQQNTGIAVLKNYKP